MGKSGVIAVVAICAAIVSVAAMRSGGASAAATATFSRTFVGDDFRSLDVRIGTQHVASTGGAVAVQLVNDGSNTYPSPAYLEARADLPIGAQITSVTFYYLDCGNTGSEPLANVYFGYYSPATRSFTYIGTSTVDKIGCDWATTVLKGTPLATVASGRRYTLGVAASGDTVRVAAPPNTTGSPYYLGGARVRYTCPSTCG